MKRDVTKNLVNWKNSDSRKPLIIRGARQIGKTWVVRELGKKHFQSYIEINFEQHPELKSIFDSLIPADILKLISLNLDQKIVPGETLLFLDEIQECPNAITALRYFFEQMPQLHIICAGSLLEFVLGTKDLKMPVGRIDFLYMHPFTFEEFLTASKKEDIREFCKTIQIGQEVNASLAKKMERLLLDYCFCGGMPRAVSAMVEKEDVDLVKREQLSIIQTYRQDFGKYQTRISSEIIETTFQAVPSMVGQKFKYSNVDQGVKAEAVKKALILLEKAGIVKRVFSTSGKGLPFSAHRKENLFKVIFVDVGLMQRILGLSIDLYKENNLLSVYRGAVAEQLAGQQLSTFHDWFEEPDLYYWHRLKRNSHAEIDYIYQYNNEIIPIEVKAGKTGTLKSLSLFMNENGPPFGVRLSLNHFNAEKGLLSIPLWGMEGFYDKLSAFKSALR